MSSAKAQEVASANGPGPGLTEVEARRRLAHDGPNATPDASVHPFRLVLGKFVAPVPCLLEVAIVLQLILGEYVEAAVVGVLLLFNAALGFFHESRAQATIDALKSRLALKASVRRDGEWREIPAAELVRGDIVKLSLGAVVAADVRLLGGEVLLDHSMVTGESLPVEGRPGLETYAGALVRRGEAVGVVTATGPRTKSGRTAELVRTAHVTSTQQKAILRVVVSLAVLNGAIAAAVIAYAHSIGLPAAEFIPLILLVLLATVPVALPATFTLATAIGARTLAGKGVLPTRLSAVDEAASMDVLCTDKTGTLTRNELAVTATRAFEGYDKQRVIALASLASAEGGQDPVDQAVRRAAGSIALTDVPRLLQFIPFDPDRKLAEATVDADGRQLRVVKGAFAKVAGLCKPQPGAEPAALELEREGLRVLAVAAGCGRELDLVGLIALSDPPREDAAACIAELRRLGVKVVMATGDAGVTAGVVGRAVGITGPVHAEGPVPGDVSAAGFEVFAGVLPEDKFRLVKGLQRARHTVGMCGDGANDAPALRQAQIGIAVSTATDVAKSAAGIVLTRPGLSGIVTAVREGRVTFQRILTYTLRSLVNKVRQVLFLAIGLVIVRHAVLTPMMMVLSMITSDFFAMSSTTDNVEPSPQPNAWRISHLTVAGAILGLVDLVFCAAALAAGKFLLHLPVPALQSLTLVTLVFNGQAVFYAVRERRRLWSSWPSRTVILTSVADVLLIPTLVGFGWLMPRLPVGIMAAVFAAAVALAFVLDQVKAFLFRRLAVA